MHSVRGRETPKQEEADVKRVAPLAVIGGQLLEPGKEEIRLYLQLEKIDLASGRVYPRVAVITSLSLYLFIEDPTYFLCEPQLTASEKRSGRKDGMHLVKEDEKYRWNTMLEVGRRRGSNLVLLVVLVVRCSVLTRRRSSRRLAQVDFLAGDQSVMALRFEYGATQLRFGDDFGLSIFKRELRALLPSGLTHWRRNFGCASLSGSNPLRAL